MEIPNSCAVVVSDSWCNCCDYKLLEDGIWITELLVDWVVEGKSHVDRRDIVLISIIVVGIISFRADLKHLTFTGH